MTTSHNRPLRIALVDAGGANWTGGITYRKNLLEALRQYAPGTEVYLVTSREPEIAVASERFKVVQHPPSDSKIPAIISKITERYFGLDYLLRTTLRSIPGGVDLTFPDRYTVGGQTASLFWIPDFQFIHLSEMYSKTQVAGLETRFKQGIKRTTLVVLSSQDAYKDYCKFAPGYESKARVLNFVAHIPARLYDIDPMTVVREYHLPEKFFYLPNQFWAHKNHRAVFEALKILKARGIEPFLVCTGNPVDPRNPLYFAELMQDISRWGLRGQVALLGLIPHEHVYSLIRQSICVVNPSLFEGWSTTVEEVKSVGKRILLSELNVHREQAPPGGIFIDPHDPEGLAEGLAEIWHETPPGPDLEMEKQARAAISGRIQGFAETFITIAREAVEIARG